MTKIACLGGSFNPPHRGHLKIALAVLRQEHFEELWFIPTQTTPLKDDQLASFEDRVQMIMRLIKPYRKLKVCTIEESLPLPNYTINTVKALTHNYPQYQFTWIMGSDQANQFAAWKDADELLKRINFLVIVRNETDQIPAVLKTLHVHQIAQISSTHIRNGKLSDTTDAVVRYMFDHELYLESIAKSMVSPARWAHVKAVKKLALELGNAHHLDPHPLKVAALFHDCTKNWKFEKAEKWINFIDSSYLEQPQGIWHQKTAETYLRRAGVIDKTILQAIGHHVTGLKGHPIAQILYIADKCEPTRDYDVTQELVLAQTNLDKSALLVSRIQKEYLQKDNNANTTAPH